MDPITQLIPWYRDGNVPIAVGITFVLMFLLYELRDWRKADEELRKRIKEIEDMPRYNTLLTQHKDKLEEQLIDFCILAGIKVVYTSGIASTTGDSKAAGQLVETTTYKPYKVNPSCPFEQDVDPQDYTVRDIIYIDTEHLDAGVWILGHELGHWIAFRRREESTEERADQYAAELIKILLKPDEYAFLKEYINIWYHIDSDKKEESNHDVERSEPAEPSHIP